MKFNFILLLAGLTLASPTIDNRDELIKRQANEACPIGYCTRNGGTKGGSGGPTVNVNNINDLINQAKGNDAKIIIVSGNIKGDAKVNVGSNKTILGKSGSSLENVGFTVSGQKNVILRNLKLIKVLPKNGDAISVLQSTNIWVDSCDLSSVKTSNPDTYDGLLDITRQSDWVTVSNSYFHDHYKTILIGAGDNDTGDRGKLHVTIANCWIKNVVTRCPAARFGKVHVVNTLIEGFTDAGINTYVEGQVLVQSTAFVNCAERAIFSQKGAASPGYAVVDDVDFGKSKNIAGKGTLTPESLPYPKIATLGSKNVRDTVSKTAGQKLAI
ncbi:Pectate lyase B [Paramyrothecium foliicola]|nr:Pectate lyase B [Paramyrothecium foliicola]